VLCDAYFEHFRPNLWQIHPISAIGGFIIWPGIGAALPGWALARLARLNPDAIIHWHSTGWFRPDLLGHQQLILLHRLRKGTQLREMTPA